MDFIVATGNAHKLNEIKRILSPLGIGALSQSEAGIRVEVEETGQTFEENARLKAVAVCKASGRPAVADDSGLMVDALGGAPGVYSARYAGEGATDDDRIEKLLAELKNVSAEKRSARFVSAICCAFPDGTFLEARGECEGFVALEKSGSGGFGYDPIFVEQSTGHTFAELTAQEKDKLGHRGKALRAFAEKLQNSGRV